jgi:hypothetical protein
LIDWLIIVFASRSSIFLLYGNLTMTDGVLQNWGLCSALGAFEQGGIFIVPHLLWHGASVFLVSFEEPPHSVASFYIQGDVDDLFWPGSSRVNTERNANNFIFCCYAQSRRIKYMFCMIFHYFKPSLYIICGWNTFRGLLTKRVLHDKVQLLLNPLM